MSIDVGDLFPVAPGILTQCIEIGSLGTDHTAVVDAKGVLAVCETAERAALVSAAVNSRYTDWLAGQADLAVPTGVMAGLEHGD